MSIPKWFVALFNRYVGLDPYRCYITDKSPTVPEDCKSILVTLLVEIEVPKTFNISKTNLGIARSVVMEDFQIEEHAQISTWRVEKVVESGLMVRKPLSPHYCMICGKPKFAKVG